MRKALAITIAVLALLIAACQADEKKLRELPSKYPAGELPLPPAPAPPGATAAGVSKVLGLVVPDWARTKEGTWAAEPTGISLRTLIDGKFDKQRGDIILGIQGYDILWGEVYRTDVNYVLCTLGQLPNEPTCTTAGQNLDATKIWIKTPAVKTDGTKHPTTDGWIITKSRDELVEFKLPTTTFEANAERYNAIVVYGCKAVGKTAAYVEYDCEGVDKKTVKVKSDRTLEAGSGKGSWKLKDFELAVAPPTPGGLGGVGTGTTPFSSPLLIENDVNDGTTTFFYSHSRPENPEIAITSQTGTAASALYSLVKGVTPDLSNALMAHVAAYNPGTGLQQELLKFLNSENSIVLQVADRNKQTVYLVSSGPETGAIWTSNNNIVLVWNEGGSQLPEALITAYLQKHPSDVQKPETGIDFRIYYIDPVYSPTAPEPTGVPCFRIGSSVECNYKYSGQQYKGYEADIGTQTGWKPDSLEIYYGGVLQHKATCTTTPCHLTIPSGAYKASGRYIAKVVLSPTAASTTATLTVLKAGTGTGTVEEDATTKRINCGTTCTNTQLTPQETVTLKATAGTSSTFAGWTGASVPTSCASTGTPPTYPATCPIRVGTAGTETKLTATFTSTTVTSGDVVCRAAIHDFLKAYDASNPSASKGTYTTDITTTNAKTKCNELQVFGKAKTGSTTEFEPFLTYDPTTIQVSITTGSADNKDALLECRLPCATGRSAIVKCKDIVHISSTMTGDPANPDPNHQNTWILYTIPTSTPKCTQ